MINEEKIVSKYRFFNKIGNLSEVNWSNEKENLNTLKIVFGTSHYKQTPLSIIAKNGDQGKYLTNLARAKHKKYISGANVTPEYFLYIIKNPDIQIIHWRPKATINKNSVEWGFWYVGYQLMYEKKQEQSKIICNNKPRKPNYFYTLDGMKLSSELSKITKEQREYLLGYLIDSNYAEIN